MRISENNKATCFSGLEKQVAIVWNKWLKILLFAKPCNANRFLFVATLSDEIEHISETTDFYCLSGFLWVLLSIVSNFDKFDAFSTKSQKTFAIAITS